MNAYIFGNGLEKGLLLSEHIQHSIEAKVVLVILYIIISRFAAILHESKAHFIIFSVNSYF